MKPVDKGATVQGLRQHGDAKPDLITRLGQACSYCECPGEPQQLHVEHIYPEANTAHPNLATNWRNFLLACGTCNTYKRHHLGDNRQTGLLRRFLWPHWDNTIKAFNYLPDGRVELATGLTPDQLALATATRNMVGLMRSPAAAADYAGTAIAYDGIRKREEAWGIAHRARTAYQENPSANQLASLLDNAAKTGHFSVWMQVFHDVPAVRRELIRSMRAAPACFDANTAPVARGRL